MNGYPDKIIDVVNNKQIETNVPLNVKKVKLKDFLSTREINEIMLKKQKEL